MLVIFLGSHSLVLQLVRVAELKKPKEESFGGCAFLFCRHQATEWLLVACASSYGLYFLFLFENENKAGNQVKFSSLYFYGRLSRVQTRGEQILFQARSTHLPVHWVLFLPCLSHSCEVQEDHACSKRHYIRSNVLRSKGFYQGEGENEICLCFF